MSTYFILGLQNENIWVWFSLILRTHNAAFATQISACTAVATGGGRAGASRAGRSRRRMENTCRAPSVGSLQLMGEKYVYRVF